MRVKSIAAWMLVWALAPLPALRAQQAPRLTLELAEYVRMPITAGSAANFFVQVSCPSTATTGAPGVSSAAPNQRPREGLSPSTVRYDGVVCSMVAGRSAPSSR